MSFRSRTTASASTLPPAAVEVPGLSRSQPPEPDGIRQSAADGDALVNARGKLVAPGLVDLGVFAVDKPAFHFGGITRAALMPDQSPPLDLPSRVGFIAKSGKPDLWVHPLAAATRGLEGRELAEIALMQEAGARGIATGRRWIADSGVMLRLLQYAAMLDLVVVAHAEDGGLNGEAAATAGEIATRLGLPAAPAEADVSALPWNRAV
jgi:dihydroorotase